MGKHNLDSRGQRLYGRSSASFDLPIDECMSSGAGDEQSSGKRRRLGAQERVRTTDKMGGFFPPSDQVDFSQQPSSSQAVSRGTNTMAPEPPPEKIESMMALGMDAETAKNYLRAKRNDVEAAANAFMDGEDISKGDDGWREDFFTADRDGNPQIHSLAATAPPSRAPSRADNRGALYPTSGAQEDADIAAAMRASQHELGVSQYEQEGGIVQQDGTETKFGPATREEYNPYSWAMVPTAQTADEVIPDADVEARRHTPGEPRILKHSTSAEYLSNLLTILHTIPIARESFLCRGFMRSDYGQDPDWWKGHTISLPKIVNLDDGRPTNTAEDHDDDLIHEIQRLMAALDASERSYIDPGALLQTDAMIGAKRSSASSSALLERFLRTWMYEAKSRTPDRDLSNLFITRLQTSRADDAYETEVCMIDLPINVRGDQCADLTELLDELLWGTGVEELKESGTYVQTPAQVLIVRMQHNDTSQQRLGVNIPPDLHMDKYLRENAAATFEVRQGIALSKRKLAMIDSAMRKLSSWRHPRTGTNLDAKTLLLAARESLDDSHPTDSTLINGDSQVPEPLSAREAEMKIDSLIGSIDRKLAELESLKQSTSKAMSELSRHGAAGLSTGEHKGHYTLCGVATKPNVTYVLRHRDEDGEEDEMLVDPDDDTTPEGMQWWRIEYEVNASASGAGITRTKCPDYDVIRAVELESASALLVYASDYAVNPALDNPQLPPELEAFVARDNEYFRAELESLQPSQPVPLNAGQNEGGSYAGVIPSIEGIERSSFDSTRVENGSPGRPSPPPYGAEEFLSHAGFGLGYGSNQSKIESASAQEDTAHEIVLDDPPPEFLDHENSGREMQMVENAHPPLAPVPRGGVTITTAVVADDDEMADESRPTAV